MKKSSKIRIKKEDIKIKRGHPNIKRVCNPGPHNKSKVRKKKWDNE